MGLLHLGCRGFANSSATMACSEKMDPELSFGETKPNVMLRWPITASNQTDQSCTSCTMREDKDVTRRGEDISLRLMMLKVKLNFAVSLLAHFKKSWEKKERQSWEREWESNCGQVSCKMNEEREWWLKESRLIRSIKCHFLIDSQWLRSRQQINTLTPPHTPLYNLTAVHHNAWFGLNIALLSCYVFPHLSLHFILPAFEMFTPRCRCHLCWPGDLPVVCALCWIALCFTVHSLN